MTQEIEFYKMHGLGNDFVIVSDKALQHIAEKELFIKAISDRRTGIGCDQFITYQHVQGNRYNMNIFNSDGSKAEACGNGTRCLTKLLHNIYRGTNFNIISAGRSLDSTLSREYVSVNMGRASLQEEWMVQDNEIMNISDLFGINIKEVIQIDVCNPHLVIFTNQLTTKDKQLFSQQINDSNLYKNGVNIGFAKSAKNHIDLDVWERGVGPTLACGSGACACFVAAQKFGFSDNKAKINFKLGSLDMSQKGEDIIMTGPASFIGKGDYYYEGK